MESNFFNRISYLINRERIGFRRKFIVFLFFLVISVIIWFLKALEKNYTAQIDYPVRYRNFPQDKTLIGELPDHLKLNVYAHGYVLFQHKISSRYLPLIIPVSSFSLKPLNEKDSGFFYMETRFMKDYIDRQMSSEFEIISIKPDTIVFPFAKVISRRIPVKQEVSYTLDQQLILKEPVLLYPDSVEVTGPDYLLDTLSFITTRRKDLGIISKNREYDLALQIPRHITLRQEEVSIRFEVEKFTEKLLSIPVKIPDAPDSLKVITFPGAISLSCQVGLSNYEKLQAEMFTAVVQFSEIAEGQTRLKIRLEKIPEFVTEVNYSPNTVEYLIER
ncbi:MAG: hypothetical protein IH594_09785 [Bacteroidales bacterium]|nr:hypothetical protein [Bacteroidales bacterium]